MKKIALLIALLSATCISAAEAIVIARGQTRKDAPQQAQMNRQADIIAKIFKGAGVAYSDIKDDELTAQNLKGARLVIFPYNAPLTESMRQTIQNFTDNGGKLMAFFFSDSTLRNILGLEPGAYTPRSKFGTPTRIQFSNHSIQGMPERIPQTSWNCITVKPSDASTKIIGNYIDAKGKSTGFAAVTQGKNGFAFAHILQNKDDAFINSAILSLAASVIPDFWQNPARKTLEQVAVIGGCENLRQLTEYISALPPGKHSQTLANAIKLDAEARQSFNGKQFLKAYKTAQEAREQARLAYLLSCKSRPGELRGVWIHSPYGIADWGWDKTIKVLKDNGFNAIFPNMLWGYVADYPSNVLPTHPSVEKRGDQIKLCLEACRKYGVEIHVWKVCWNMGHRTPENLRQQMVKAKRTQVTLEGKDSRFLAPHLKVNQDLEVNALVEIVKKYPVDGVHLDYIRYPEDSCDFSPSAQKAFERFLGRKVPNWPRDCAAGGSLRKQFNEWRRSNITQTVKRISEEVHKARPDAKLSAAVYGGWASAPNSIAQDAQTWIRNGWLDFVCPMNYTTSRNYFETLTARQVETVNGSTPLYIGIGSYVHPDAPTIAEQIELTRKLGADGFICFDHSRSFAENMLPELAKGPTSRTAKPPFPHHSPKIATTLAKSRTPLLDGAFAFPEPVTATIRFPKNFTFPKGSRVRLIKDGHYFTPIQPNINIALSGTTLTCTFIPPTAGTYRFDISDDKTFTSLTSNIYVLEPEAVRQKLIREGVPQFAKNGKPRVAIWNPDAYGATDITATLKETNAYDLAPIFNLKPDSLAACDAVILPQPRKNAALFFDAKTSQTLHNYIQNGGALLVTHAVVGIRGFNLICPEVTAKACEPPLKTNRWLPCGRHPIVQNLAAKKPIETFVDLIAMEPGPNGTPILLDAKQEKSVAIAGPCAKGRYVALGLGLGIARGDADCELSDNEAQLLVNALNWLLKR